MVVDEMMKIDQLKMLSESDLIAAIYMFWFQELFGIKWLLTM